ERQHRIAVFTLQLQCRTGEDRTRSLRYTAEVSLLLFHQLRRSGLARRNRSRFRPDQLAVATEDIAGAELVDGGITGRLAVRVEHQRHSSIRMHDDAIAIDGERLELPLFSDQPLAVSTVDQDRVVFVAHAAT